MRILITGASGSGTTTLGKTLCTKLNFNFVDADDCFWAETEQPFTQKRPKEERLSLIFSQFEQYPNTIVAGCVSEWDDKLEDSFDLIVFLYLDANIRIKRLKEREIKNHGFAKPEFLQWAADYDRGPKEGRSLKKQKQWLSERFCPIITIEGDVSLDDKCRRILGYINKNNSS
jgi:adenylate kinase family enzyme